MLDVVGAIWSTETLASIASTIRKHVDAALEGSTVGLLDLFLHGLRVRPRTPERGRRTGPVRLFSVLR